MWWGRSEGAKHIRCKEMNKIHKAYTPSAAVFLFGWLGFIIKFWLYASNLQRINYCRLHACIYVRERYQIWSFIRKRKRANQLLDTRFFFRLKWVKVQSKEQYTTVTIFSIKTTVQYVENAHICFILSRVFTTQITVIIKFTMIEGTHEKIYILTKRSKKWASFLSFFLCRFDYSLSLVVLFILISNK